MRRHYLPRLFILFALLLVISKPAQAGPIQILEQKEYSELISKNKGDVIVVTVFATWCPACRVEMPNVVATYKQYDKKPVVFIGLSVDGNAQKLQNYLKEEQVNFPVYIAGKSVTSMLNVSAIPHNIIYGKDGKITHNSAGTLSVDELKKLIEQNLKK